MKNVFVLVEEKKAFPSMLQVAKHVGKSRVFRKDFEKLGLKEMTEAEYQELLNEGNEPEAAVEVKAEEKVETPAAEVKPEVVETETSEEEEEDEVEEAPESEEEEVEEAPESEEEEVEELAETEEETSEEEEKAEEVAGEVEFSDMEEFIEVMKGMSGEEVIELAQSLGVTWNEHSHKGINRMRASMAMREKYFPGQKRPKIEKSSWRNIPYKDLEALALQNNLTWTVTADEKINRMWVIDALKKAGIQSPAAQK
ncbi:DNA binding protein [Bacillus phage Nachito]|nr:DNA binding protein [Bacillus phage Nachito]